MQVLSERIVLKDPTCPVIRLDKARRHDKSVGFSISLGLHALIFILVGVSFVKPPQFGVEQGLGSIEVDLVSATLETLQTSVEQPKQEQGDDVVHIKERPTPQRKIENSVGGAISEARPDYLKNPAPVYPEAARRRKQTGTVVVLAIIDSKGFVLKVALDKSSGFGLLDQSALKTVATWQFRPAMLGSMAVESSVRVPIKFNLERP